MSQNNHLTPCFIGVLFAVLGLACSGASKIDKEVEDLRDRIEPLIDDLNKIDQFIAEHDAFRRIINRKHGYVDIHLDWYKFSDTLPKSVDISRSHYDIMRAGYDIHSAAISEYLKFYGYTVSDLEELIELMERVHCTALSNYWSFVVTDNNNMVLSLKCHFRYPYTKVTFSKAYRRTDSTRTNIIKKNVVGGWYIDVGAWTL